jgi:O-methyltransferase
MSAGRARWPTLMAFAKAALERLPPRAKALAYDVRYLGLPLPLRVAKPYTLLSDINLLFLLELARRAEADGVEGDVVECGVYRGGSAAVLGHAVLGHVQPRKLWLYDAFRGMPKASAEDDEHSHAIESQFVGSEEDTRRLLARLGVPKERFEIDAGWFHQTLPRSPVRRVALLHIDCDFYEPVKLVFETFYERVSRGGYVVVNDYGSFAGARQATDEFLGARGLSPSLLQIDPDAHYLQKRT